MIMNVGYIAAGYFGYVRQLNSHVTLWDFNQAVISSCSSSVLFSTLYCFPSFIFCGVERKRRTPVRCLIRCPAVETLPQVSYAAYGKQCEKAQSTPRIFFGD